MYNCPDCGCCCDHDKPCCQQFGGGNTDHLGERGGCKRLDPRAVPAEQRIGPVVPAETSFASAAVPSFDFSALGDLSQQAADADQQFDLHYGAAQDEYLISCIYLARIHALTAKAGRYGGGTWTKWYESKGLGEGSVRRMIQNGEVLLIPPSWRN